MITELNYLVAVIALYFVMIAVQTFFTDKEHGIKHGVGARDNTVDKTLMVQRSKRANANMVESLLIFIPLIFVAVIAERTNSMTALGAALFFWARVAFAPLYWFGVPWLRTGAWFIGIIGLILIFLQILPFTGAT